MTEINSTENNEFQNAQWSNDDSESEAQILKQ